MFIHLTHQCKLQLLEQKTATEIYRVIYIYTAELGCFEPSISNFSEDDLLYIGTGTGILCLCTSRVGMCLHGSAGNSHHPHTGTYASTKPSIEDCSRDDHHGTENWQAVCSARSPHVCAFVRCTQGFCQSWQRVCGLGCGGLSNDCEERAQQYCRNWGQKK